MICARHSIIHASAESATLPKTPKARAGRVCSANAQVEPLARASGKVWRLHLLIRNRFPRLVVLNDLWKLVDCLRRERHGQTRLQGAGTATQSADGCTNVQCGPLACASCACVHFFSSRAFMRFVLSSDDTFASARVRAEFDYQFPVASIEGDMRRGKGGGGARTGELLRLVFELSGLNCCLRMRPCSGPKTQVRYLVPKFWLPNMHVRTAVCDSVAIAKYA